MIKTHLCLTTALICLSLHAKGEDLEGLFDSAIDPSLPKKEHSASQSSPLGILAYLLQDELPKPHPDQSLFIRHIENGDWNKALLQFKVAFEGHSFQQSANGKALFALAHIRSGLPVTGLERLFTLENPRKVHPEIRRMLKEALPESHPAWGLADIQWRAEFAEIFPAETEYQIIGGSLLSPKDPKALADIFSKLPRHSLSRARAGWALVIHHSTNNDVEQAAKILADLMKSKAQPVTQDLMEITAARLLFQRAHYAAAIKYYEKIDKKSEYWTDAQEEMAWAFIRKGEPQNAMALSQSLVTPVMAQQAGPESFFVHALAQLKICDYPGVISSLQAFPKNFKARSESLKKLSASSESPQIKKILTRLKGGKLSRAHLGADGAILPRKLSRDQRLYILAQAAKNLEMEANAADTLYSQSLALTGLQGYFDKLRQTTSLRSQTALNAAQSRIKDLAQIENSEIKDILSKLHIVEAEVIQQVSLAHRVATKNKAPAEKQKGATGSKDRDALTFPANDELWFDEIGNYRVDVKKACHADMKGRSS